jgi:hypothetical protein
VTNTSQEGLNINPSLSGDGRRISFESTEDLAGAGGSDHFRALRADLSSAPATFVQMGAARAPAPGISQDGSIIAFAAKENPLGTNADGNSEIFLYNSTTLRQITNTTPNDISTRVSDGNFLPSLSDDGRFIAFSSNRNLASQNADGNLEIFIFDTASNAFAQLTNTAGVVGATDAKISGDGTRVAYIRDGGAQASAQRDLILQDRAGGTTRLLAGNVTNLAFTYGRAISDDGLRVVYAADTAANSSQVFLFDGRVSNSTRQITALEAREADVPLHPTISGDGTRIAFATRRPITITVGEPEDEDNSDHSIELYTYDIPTGQFARVTPDAPTTADGFSGSTRIMEVVSSLSDDGSLVAFNFPRVISGDVTSGLENNSEIYVTGTAVRPATGSLTVLDEASFGHEPSTTKAIAPESRAVALGGALASNSIQTQKQPDGNFPTNVDGTTVTVNGRSAQIFYVSPTQVKFLVPAQTELGTATVIVTNAEGFQSRGTVSFMRTAPGIFTESGDGLGKAVVINANMTTEDEFDPSSGQLRLIIFTTGVRRATQVTATAGGRALTVESYLPSADMPGMDEVRVLVPADLRGAGTVNLTVRGEERDSNPASITFGGDPCRDILINEVLADPPATNGDANRDGTISGNGDEFVELVNRSGRDIDISGYQLLTRSTGAANDTVRHTFAAGTIFPSGSAIVIFGGGGTNFDPKNPAFGGALVLKASSGGLSLTNSGGVVTLRQPSLSIVNIFSYGGSTGLNGDANQSLTRSPDAGGNPDCAGFVLHSTAPGSIGPYSPGTRINGTPFVTTTIASIDVSPTAATIDAGAKQQFTAKAYDASNNEIPGVIFFWESSNTAVATIDQTGLATSLSAGTTEIRATARGVQSAPATLTVRAVERVLTSITVMPNPATIPVGGTQQFTAQGFDQFGNQIAALTFTWESTSTNVATIDQNGLATGVGQGQTTIRATSQSVTGTATLNVTPPTIVINEVLADPPDTNGDANRDGTRSGTDDEFVELVNSTSGVVNISGWTLRTRATNSATETLRHTFGANTTLPAGEAIVVFGGGGETFDPTNAAFACAQVVKASSGGLSLTNSGLTVIVRDSAGNLVAQFTYGTDTSLAADNDQSLTRSPDITGSFVQHLAATGAGTRRFSSGTRVNGTPFGACPARLTSITISPPSASVLTGQTTQFTAQAFDQFGQPLIGATITFASDNTGIATVDSVTTDPNTGIATATVKGQSAGTAHITAQATDGTTTVTSSQSTLTVNAAASTYVITGQVKDSGNNPLSGVLITFEKNFQGTLTTQTTLTDANGNYSSGDLGCQNNVKVTPSKIGFIFIPSAIAFTSTQCLTGSDVANFTGAPPPPGTLVISQLYVAGGNANATYTNDFVEIFNSGTTTVDFSVTHYSIQFAGTGASFGSPSTTAKTNITSGTIAPGQYFLVQEASGGANGAALPAADATGTINLLSAGGKVALVVGTAALPAFTCPGDDGATPFNPNDSTVADFVGYGGNANTAGHCYEGPLPAAAPNSASADFRKSGGCTDTDNNAADFFVNAPIPRNTTSALNSCSAGITPDLSISDATVTEGNSGTVTATFTVSLSTPAQGADVTFDIATQNNTALSGSDYVARSLTNQIIPAGQQTLTFTVTINGDTSVEPDETYLVNVTNVNGANIADGQATGTIQNDDLPSLSINDVTQNEGDNGASTFSFTVHLSSPAPANVTFDIATADVTAQDGTPSNEDTDYLARSVTGATILAGQQDYTFDVTVNGDLTIEPNETFLVNVTNLNGATTADAQGQGTIQNDDSPSLSISDVTMSEGNAGTKTFQFTVSLSQPAPAGGVTFNIATQDNTALVDDGNPAIISDNDYIGKSLTSQTIPEGSQTYTFDVIVNGDTLVEPDETFFVNLSGAVNATITDPQGVGTITNDDTADLVISQVYGGGGNAGAPFTHDFIEVFNQGTTVVDLAGWSVQYNTASDTDAWSVTALCPSGHCALAPGQYFLVREAGSGTTNLPTPDAIGTIAMGSTSGKVALVNGTTALTGACPSADPNVVDRVGYGGTAATADFCFEGAAPAPAPSNTTSDFRKAGGCQDTDNNSADFFVHTPFPRNSSSPLNDCSAGRTTDIFISDVTVTEGNTGTVPATFTVTLASPSASTVTVDYSTANGTATAPADYQVIATTQLVFNPGDVSKTITVNVNGDTLDEPDETYLVNLTNASNAAIVDNQGQGTITDDDVPPALTVTDVSANEGNGGPTTFSFTVHLLAPALTGGVTFDISTADGTAQDGTPAGEDTDYVTRSVIGATIPAGQQDYTFDVTVNGDMKIEPNETFFVNVTNISGATLTGGDGQGLGTIQNDDSPTLSINDVIATEGNTGTKIFQFTVSLSLPAPAGGVTFDIATADGTAQDDNPATEDNDYVARTLTTQTIPEGSQTYTFDVTVNGDLFVEPDETFFVNVTNVSGATSGDTVGLGTIQNDDTPLLVISQIYAGGNNASATYKNDFIEIFNRGTTTVNLSGYSVQYAPATNSTFTVIATLTNVNLAPGQYYLIKVGPVGTTGADLPAPDVTGTTTDMAVSGGKVALVNGTTAITGSTLSPTSPLASGGGVGCPTSSNIVDFVGYGSTATCFEGTGRAPAATTNARSVQRKSGGCQDTNDNSQDFTAPTTAPVARNTATTPAPCP